MLYVAKQRQLLGERLSDYIDRASAANRLASVPGLKTVIGDVLISSGLYRPRETAGLMRLVVSFVECYPDPSEAARRPYHALAILRGPQLGAPVTIGAYHTANGSTQRWKDVPFPPDSDLVDVLDLIEAVESTVPQFVEDPQELLKHQMMGMNALH